MPLDSLATVLLLPKPWFRFSTRTSSVAELDLHLVAFKRNFNFFLFCIVTRTVLSVWISEWKIENSCFQEPITYTECSFRSSSARSVFYWDAFPENSSKLFLFWKSSRTLVNKYVLSFRALPLETGQLEWICCLLGALCRTFHSVMAWFLIRGGGGIPMMAYTRRLHPKGVPFSGFRYMKGRGFTRWSIWKAGREICHLGQWNGPKGRTDEFLWLYKVEKTFCDSMIPIWITRHLQQLKGIHFSTAGIRKGYLFREKWFKEG